MSQAYFHGSYQLAEIGYRLWRYIPDPDGPLTFTTRDGRVIVIDSEFETDGATVPRVFWSLPGLDPMDWPRGAILHDWLWERHHAGQPVAGFFESNRILQEAVIALGWSRLLACVVRRAIDLFGWAIWVKPESVAVSQR
jgi:hypothetical protein